MAPPILEVFATRDRLIQEAAQRVEDRMRQAIDQRGSCTLALSGGSTPKPLYAALSTADLPWEQVHFFWGDERYVPPSHPESNEGMARQVWLDRVPIPAANIHPMPTDAGDPATDADRYDTHLKNFFASTSRLAADGFPIFDLILLGLGDDGHTASLFPHTAALTVHDRCVTVGNKDGQPRLTFTVPLINHARSIFFLVSGANKQSALQAIFAPEGNAEDDRELNYQYPARLIRPQGELCWLLDGEAGNAWAQ